MDLSFLLDLVDEASLAAILGLATGIVFGISAQRSSFCLRAATVEFARGELGPRMAVWLLTFSTALVWVQCAQMLGLFKADDARMMAVTVRSLGITTISSRALAAFVASFSSST